MKRCQAQAEAAVNASVLSVLFDARIGLEDSLPSSQLISWRIPNVFAPFTRRCGGECHSECHRDLLLTNSRRVLRDKNRVFTRSFSDPGPIVRADKNYVLSTDYS